METHQNLTKSIAGRLPIEEVCLEYNKFDLHKLNNPEIKGKEYQEGRKKGYENAREYVLCRDKHTCQLCKKSKGLLETHHVIWRSQGGGDSPENLLTLCAKCHAKVHDKTKTDKKVRELFKGMCKRQVHTTLLNSIMPEFHKWLSYNFKKITVTYGYETKQKRYELGLPKQHEIDAYLISLPEAKEAGDIDWDNVEVNDIGVKHP